MSEWHNLGKHARKLMLSALHGSPQLMAIVGAALEAKGEDIDENTVLELRIDAIRARAKPKAGEDKEDADGGEPGA